MSSKTRQIKDLNRKLIKANRIYTKEKEVNISFFPFLLINNSKDIIFTKYRRVINAAKRKYTEVLNSIDVIVSKMKLKDAFDHNVSDISDTKTTDKVIATKP
jgi:hypothetical protein